MSAVFGWLLIAIGLLADVLYLILFGRRPDVPRTAVVLVALGTALILVGSAAVWAELFGWPA